MCVCANKGPPWECSQDLRQKTYLELVACMCECVCVCLKRKRFSLEAVSWEPYGTCMYVSVCEDAYGAPQPTWNLATVSYHQNPPFYSTVHVTSLTLSCGLKSPKGVAKSNLFFIYPFSVRESCNFLTPFFYSDLTMAIHGHTRTHRVK